MAVQSGTAPLRPGWLRLGLERPSQIKGCGEKDCLPEGIDPVDTHCEKHGDFLPGTPGKGRAILLTACRIAAGPAAEGEAVSVADRVAGNL